MMKWKGRRQSTNVEVQPPEESTDNSTISRRNGRINYPGKLEDLKGTEGSDSASRVTNKTRKIVLQRAGVPTKTPRSQKVDQVTPGPWLTQKLK